MRRLFVFLAFCGPFFWVATAWAAPVLFVESVAFDFGHIVQGEQVEYTFRFRNAGDELLEISQLRSSCGCTAALLSTPRLAPGTVGELQVKFDSHGFRGRVQKVISFDTNDPRHPSVDFSLGGEIKAELYLNPQRVNWGSVKAGAQLTQEIEISNDSDRPIRLQDPEVTSADISARLSAAVLEPGQRSTIEIRGIFPVGKKRLSGYVIIHSDFSSVPLLKVPVMARLSKD